MRRSYRPPAAVVAGLLLAAATALVPAGWAQAAGTAGISGTVTSEADDAPEPGVVVSAYAYDDISQGWVIVDSAETDDSGHYSITGLEAGSYVVGFYDSPQHVWEFHDGARNADTADQLPLADAQALTGIDASLEPAGAVSGTVTGEGGAPLGSIYVIAHRWSPALGYWESVGGNLTQSDGTYVVPGLPADSYKLEFVDFDGSHLGEYWDDQASLLDAAVVEVAAGATTSGRDAVLALAARIAGTVTGPGGTPLSRVAVSAYRYAAADDGYWEFTRHAITGDDGTYEIQGLPSGTYRISFEDFDGNHVSEYWDDAVGLDDATDIPLTAGSTASGKDAELGVAGHVTGTVTGTAGPLEEVEVSALRHDPVTDEWLYAGAYVTESEGTYDIGGLPTGTYRIRFRDIRDAHLTEWWDDEPTLETAQDVVVTAGSTVSDRDAVLAPTATTAPPTAPPAEPEAPAPTQTSTPTTSPVPTPVTAPTPVPTPTISNTSRPRITGTPEVGATLKVRRGTWSPADATLRVQWLADGKRIRKATRTRFTVTRAQLGKRLTVRVTAVLAGAPDVAVTTRPTAKIKE